MATNTEGLNPVKAGHEVEPAYVQESGTAARPSGSKRQDDIRSIEGTLLHDVCRQQQDFFRTGVTRTFDFRVEQLTRLREGIKRFEGDLQQAVSKDLRKSKIEMFFSELGFVYEEIRFARQHLREWMKPRRVKTPLLLVPATSRVVADPLGQVLVISPWNYPFQLLFSPLVSAIAAGNVAVLKPSELTPFTSEVMARLVAETFEERFISLFQGGPDVSQHLTRQSWGKIFFTGSTRVGQQVAQAAAETLTPVTLELGGKSPVIVDKTANLEVAAKRIVWGKFLNAGQTCIAPDYLLVDATVKDQLVGKMQTAIQQLFGRQPERSDNYTRIVSDAHFDRLRRLMEDGQIIFGGEVNREERYIGPTLIDGVSENDPVMREEIFGPLLPIISFDREAEAVNLIQKLPQPLALYVFTEDQAVKNRLTRDLTFGGGAVNDTLMHFMNPHMPFGGVGLSGQGHSHGHYGFATFSHEKSLLENTSRVDLPVRYPPYTGWKERIFRFLLDR
jgi:aldehyde dehydrogenase (NAD+)